MLLGWWEARRAGVAGAETLRATHPTPCGFRKFWPPGFRKFWPVVIARSRVVYRMHDRLTPRASSNQHFAFAHPPALYPRDRERLIRRQMVPTRPMTDR